MTVQFCPASVSRYTLSSQYSLQKRTKSAMISTSTTVIAVLLVNHGTWCTLCVQLSRMRVCQQNLEFNIAHSTLQLIGPTRENDSRYPSLLKGRNMVNHQKHKR